MDLSIVSSAHALLIPFPVGRPGERSTQYPILIPRYIPLARNSSVGILPTSNNKAHSVVKSMAQMSKII